MIGSNLRYADYSSSQQPLYPHPSIGIRTLQPLPCPLTACQTFASVGVRAWRKSRERWRMAGAMRCSFVGFAIRPPFATPLIPIPFSPPGRRVTLAENAAYPLIYTEEAGLK